MGRKGHCLIVLLDQLSQSSDERGKKSGFLMRDEIEATLTVFQGTSILGKLSSEVCFFFSFSHLSHLGPRNTAEKEAE